MALDVWLLAEGETPGPTAGEIVARLHSDGYYEFLRAFWPASSSTGKTIDLCDVAIYRGANLRQLRGNLVRAREAATAREASWRIPAGEQLKPVRKKLYATVERSQLLALIDLLVAATDRAIAEQKEIHFFGD